MDDIKGFSGFSFLKDIKIEEGEDKEVDYSALNPKEIIAQQNYERCGVSEKFYNVSLDSFKAGSIFDNTVLERAKTFTKEMIERDYLNWVWLLYGDYGTGKTHLACSAIREILKHKNLKAKYTTAFKLILEYEGCQSFKSEKNKLQMLDEYSDLDLLAIDEIGRGMKSEMEKEILTYIICQRYENNKPTILVSNMNKEEFFKFLGGAVFDRLKECGLFAEFRGTSKRGQ